MIKLQFDLEKKIPLETLEKESDDIEARMRRNLLDNNDQDDFKAFHKLKSICNKMDYYNSGCITLPQFFNVLQQLSLEKDKRIMQHLFERYDKDDNDTMNHDFFCRCIFAKSALPQKVPKVRAVVEQVKSRILERGMNGMRGLSGAFRVMDSNKNLKLSREEFANGLKRYGLDLSKEDLTAVVSAFDRDGDGVTVTEFLKTLRGKLNDRRKKLVELAFKQLDRDGSGLVEFQEICSIYDATQHPDVVRKHRTVEEVLLEFIQSWDKDGDGTITLAEFFDYYKDISCSIDEDDYFELMIRNAWHLAGGEGWCANSSNLRVLIVHQDDSQEVVCINNDLGIDKKDMSDVRRRLEEQGLTDIKMVKLCM